MKKITIITYLFVLFLANVNAQIPAKIHKNGDLFEKHPKFKFSRTEISKKIMPAFNLTHLLEEDKLTNKLDAPFRFGKNFDVNLSLNDGKWKKTSEGKVWNLMISSKGAYSINFIFNDLYLPDGAELYIFNEEGTMVYGPITSKQNSHQRLFLTDLIKGESVIIQLFEPKGVKSKSRLQIKSIVHAYRNILGDFSVSELGDSDTCNKNIECYHEFDEEADAVALVLLSNGNELCSGSLINNTSQDFRSFFLTAFHCIDIGDPNIIFDQDERNGILEDYEITETENWMFRFQYRTTSCDGNTISSFITYNKANFRAAWKYTDFALIELVDTLAGDSRHSWLGWDRTNNIPTSGKCIHHPSGDVMKISLENNVFLTSPWDPLDLTEDEMIEGVINDHWLVDFDIGVVEHGSSGAPIINNNGRIVGQLHGNKEYNSDQTFCEQNRAEFGRFNISWLGGFTETTRLRDWLDDCSTGAQTTNTVRSPYIYGPSDVGKISSSNFIVNNLPEGAIVSDWITSENVSFVSKGTINYILIAKTEATGSGWIKAVITGASCNPIIIKKTFSIGAPIIGDYNIYGGYDNVTFNSIDYFHVESAQKTISYQWYIVPTNGNCSIIQLPKFIGSSTGTNVIVNHGSCEGLYRLRCEAINSCCSNFYQDKIINVYNPSGGGEENNPCDPTMSIFPNPSNNNEFTSFKIQYPDLPCDDETDYSLTVNQEHELKIYDLFGNLVHQVNFNSDIYILKNANFKKGIYIVSVTDKKGKLHQKRLNIK